MAPHLHQNLSTSKSDDDEVLGTCGQGESPVISQPPPPLLTHHVLDFRLANHSVYRSIVVPSNYDFQLVHRLIQRAFGWSDTHFRWSDTHLHQFEVRHNCEFYKAKAKRTWMKASAGGTVYILAHKDMMLDDLPNFFRDEKRVTVRDIWPDTRTYATETRFIGLKYLVPTGKCYVEITCSGLKQLEAPSNLPYVQEGKDELSREHWKMGHDECLALHTLLKEEFSKPELYERDSWRDDLNGDVNESHDFEGGLESGDDNLDDEKRGQVTALRRSMAEDMETNRCTGKEQKRAARIPAEPLQETSSNKRAAEEELQQGAPDKRTRLEGKSF